MPYVQDGNRLPRSFNKKISNYKVVDLVKILLSEKPRVANAEDRPFIIMKEKEFRKGLIAKYDEEKKKTRILQILRN